MLILLVPWSSLPILTVLPKHFSVGTCDFFSVSFSLLLLPGKTQAVGNRVTVRGGCHLLGMIVPCVCTLRKRELAPEGGQAIFCSTSKTSLYFGPHPKRSEILLAALSAQVLVHSANRLTQAKCFVRFWPRRVFPGSSQPCVNPGALSLIRWPGAVRAWLSAAVTRLGSRMCWNWLLRYCIFLCKLLRQGEKESARY